MHNINSEKKQLSYYILGIVINVMDAYLYCDLSLAGRGCGGAEEFPHHSSSGQADYSAELEAGHQGAHHPSSGQADYSAELEAGHQGARGSQTVIYQKKSAAF